MTILDTLEPTTCVLMGPRAHRDICCHEMCQEGSQVNLWPLLVDYWMNHKRDSFHQQPLPYVDFNQFRRKEIFDICKDSQASGSSSRSFPSEPSDCHPSKSIHAEWLPSFILSANNRSIKRPKFLTFPNNISIGRKRQVHNLTKQHGLDSSRMP